MIRTFIEDVGLAGAALITAAVVGVLLVGNSDFKEETRQQAEYCENVKAKLWPDYRETYKTECTEDKMQKYFEILGEKS